MERERIRLKEKLDEELAGLRFERQAEVLARALPPSRRERLAAWWNREIELPVVPLGAAFTLLLAVFGAWLWTGQPARPEEDPSPQARELIEAGGNTYWKSDYERAVAAREDPR